ncbi:MAG TPA: DUF2634 domain-containing protein [Vicinamibacterales bacterium]|nr:DUF2634 domain-containing protein [Vicinamibacterales bacterium]
MASEPQPLLIAADEEPDGFADALEELGTVTVTEPEVPPLGRSWSFDWGTERFRRGGRGPLEIRGVLTLVQWIDKCLRTQRNSSPIAPDGYGLDDPDRELSLPVSEINVGDLEERVRDALTFHPRIVDVVDFDLETNPDDEIALLTYTVVTDPPIEDAEVLTLRTRIT